MGKLSDIEQLKLKATYFNNLSAGLLLSGILIPYLAVVQHSGDIASALVGGKFLDFKYLTPVISAIFAMGLAFYGGKKMRGHAIETIAKIDEEKSS
jgi:hypothetical protein